MFHCAPGRVGCAVVESLLMTSLWRRSCQVDSKSQKRARLGLEMLSHSWRPKQSVHPLGGAGIVFAKHLQQFDGELWLKFQQGPSQ